MTEASLLAQFDLAVLRRTAENTFQAVGAVPEWIGPILPGISTGKPLLLEGVEPFLESFLPAAEEFWEAGDEGALPSGIWMAGPDEVPVDASATRHDGEPILVLQGLQAFFPEQERQLQLAREHLLLNEQLAKETERRQVLVHCVVHDLNSPLAALKLALEMLPGMTDEADRARVLALAQRQVAKQSDLVTDILEAFKAEADALTEGAAEVLTVAEVEACLHEVGADLEAILKRKRIEYRVEVAGDVPSTAKVRGSQKRLRRLIFNLADNAVRIAPRKSCLRVRVAPGPDGGLDLFVEDEGPGLEENAEAEIFQKLRQGRGGRGKVGLGLYYCRITARSWGGDVGCENREEGGARFWIRLVDPEAAPSADEASE